MKTPEEDKKSTTSDDKKKKNEIDLRNEVKMIGNKVSSTYDLVDDEIKTIILDNDITVKLISNNKGVFVDFRKYYKGYPTKKGIRILASKFARVAEIFASDIKTNVPDLESLNNII